MFHVCHFVNLLHEFDSQEPVMNPLNPSDCDPCHIHLFEVFTIESGFDQITT